MQTAGDLRTNLIPTAVKTSAYTAHHGDFVMADTTAAPFTIKLPLVPVQNGAVGIRVVAGGNTATVAAAGADAFNVYGGVTTQALSLGECIILQYWSGLWIVQADAGFGGGGGGAPVINGLLYIPSQSGVPSGTPTPQSGLVPVVFETTSNQIWAYSNGAWKAVTTS